MKRSEGPRSLLDVLERVVGHGLVVTHDGPRGRAIEVLRARLEVVAVSADEPRPRPPASRADG